MTFVLESWAHIPFATKPLRGVVIDHLHCTTTYPEYKTDFISGHKVKKKVSEKVRRYYIFNKGERHPKLLKQFEEIVDFFYI